MEPESDVHRFWENHLDDVEILDNGKLRFTATGMDFPPTATLAVLEAYRKGRAMQRAAAAKYDFDQHKPFLVAHKERSDKHFLYCTLTNKTVPRLPHKVEQHISGKKYKRLQQEALKRIEERRKRREEAAKFKKKKDTRRKNGENGDENPAEEEEKEDNSGNESMKDDELTPKLKEEDIYADQDEKFHDDGDIHLDPDATLKDILSDSSEGEDDDVDDEDMQDDDDDDDDDDDSNGSGKKQRALVKSESTEDEADDDDGDMEDVKPAVQKASRKSRVQAANLKRQKSKHQRPAKTRTMQLSSISPSNKSKQTSDKKKRTAKPSSSAGPTDTTTKPSTAEKRKRSSVSLPRKMLRVRQKRKVT